MKAAFNDVNIIIRKRETLVDCITCCFYHKRDVCFNNELRYRNICHDRHTLDINIDDIFKL